MTEGTSLLPSGAGITRGVPSSTIATRLFVVPRSIPTIFGISGVYLCPLTHFQDFVCMRTLTRFPPAWRVDLCERTQARWLSRVHPMRAKPAEVRHRTVRVFPLSAPVVNRFLRQRPGRPSLLQAVR